MICVERTRRTSIIDRIYPEVAAGGYSRVDSTVEFYGRVNALLNSEMVVLDFGAGPGTRPLSDTSHYRRSLRILRGKVQKVIGVDIDEVVRSNRFLDECYVVTANSALPVPSASVDLIVSDWTFEHIENAEFVAAELSRILKPAGWLCARTPNRWGYIGLAANVIPNRYHRPIVGRLQLGSHRKEADVYPTSYRMNTLRVIRRLFPCEAFENYSYAANSEPAYFGNSVIAWRAAICFYSVVPPAMKTELLIFLRRKP